MGDDRKDARLDGTWTERDLQLWDDIEVAVDNGEWDGIPSVDATWEDEVSVYVGTDLVATASTLTEALEQALAAINEWR